MGEGFQEEDRMWKRTRLKEAFAMKGGRFCYQEKILSSNLMLGENAEVIRTIS